MPPAFAAFAALAALTTLFAFVFPRAGFSGPHFFEMQAEAEAMRLPPQNIMIVPVVYW